MYLKSLTMENFRKFGTKNNTVEFAAAKDYIAEEDLNVASKITVIVGKNNSGKTTVATALESLLSGQTCFAASDFNFNYLNKLLKSYTNKLLQQGNVRLPTMSFVLKIGIDNDSDDLLTNIFPFITLGTANNSDIVIKAVWAPEDEQLFVEKLKQLVAQKKLYKKLYFDRFLDLINKCKFSLTYIDSNGKKCEHFNIKNLIEIKSIKANLIKDNDCLTRAFTKIVDYRYEYINRGDIDSGLDKDIEVINEKLLKYIEKEHTQYINGALQEIISSEKCQVLLKVDLTFQKLLSKFVKYEYIEGINHIPEQQFGLGYTNLMMIVAEIISYMEQYPDSSFNSRINLITIEEPETFMHPQMQEMFIKHINQMVATLLAGKNKHVNTQIIITTHSAHILNSKIHEGNSFNNINYIIEQKGAACAICLNDAMILRQDGLSPADQQANLRYIKKHITLGVSELFFADAAIFAEGISEYVLLKHYLSLDSTLAHNYLSLVMINGAFAHVYRGLIDTLRIPVLIVTDIDFKRSKEEKDSCTQMTAELLNERVTTNPTLQHFYSTGLAKQIIDNGYFADEHCQVVCQQQDTDGYYATSFEESFVLANCGDSKVRKIVAKMIDHVEEEVTEQWIKDHSYRIQLALSNKKSKFANQILYEILIDEEGTFLPQLPKYIQDGLNFLKQKLGTSR